MIIETRLQVVVVQMAKKGLIICTYFWLKSIETMQIEFPVLFYKITKSVKKVYFSRSIMDVSSFIRVNACLSALIRFNMFLFG
jgi:hypothetical protein